MQRAVMQAPSLPLSRVAPLDEWERAADESPARSWPRPLDAGLALAVFVAHPLLCNPAYTFLTGVGAGLLGAMTVLLITRYGRTGGRRLPWLEYLFVHLYVQFGVATTTEPPVVGFWEITPTAESHERAMLIAIVCSFAMIGGYALAKPVFKRVTSLKIFPPLTDVQIAAAARVYFWPCALFVVAYALYPRIKDVLYVGFAVFVGFFDRNMLAAVCGMAYLAIPSKASLFRLIAVAGIVIVTSLMSSMLGDLLLPLGTVVVLWWMKRKRFPVMAVAAGGLIMVLIQPVKGYYRALRWGANATEIGMVDAWEEAFARSHEAGSDGSDEARHRLGELSVLAYTIEIVPRAVPHLDGESYKYIPMTLVPRVIWPDKPNLTKIGTDWIVVRLGLHDDAIVDQTSVGISLLSHGYFEHGTFGSIAFLLIDGFIFGFMALLFTGSRARTLAGSFHLVNLVHATESGLIGFSASLWQCVFMAIATVWVLYALGRIFPIRGGSQPA